MSLSVERKFGAGDVTQRHKHLPDKGKIMSSIPGTRKKKKKGNLACKTSVPQEMASGVMPSKACSFGTLLFFVVSS